MVQKGFPAIIPPTPVRADINTPIAATALKSAETFFLMVSMPYTRKSRVIAAVKSQPSNKSSPGEMMPGNKEMDRKGEYDHCRYFGNGA